MSRESHTYTTSLGAWLLARDCEMYSGVLASTLPSGLAAISKECAYMSLPALAAMLQSALSSPTTDQSELTAPLLVTKKADRVVVFPVWPIGCCAVTPKGKVPYARVSVLLWVTTTLTNVAVTVADTLPVGDWALTGIGSKVTSKASIAMVVRRFWFLLTLMHATRRFVC